MQRTLRKMHYRDTQGNHVETHHWGPEYKAHMYAYVVTEGSAENGYRSHVNVRLASGLYRREYEGRMRNNKLDAKRCAVKAAVGMAKRHGFCHAVLTHEDMTRD